MVADAGVLAPVVFVGLIVAQAVLGPLPAPALAMGAGYSFGIYEGFLLTWFGCLVGGVISFWISRRVGRDLVAGSERMQRLDRFVDEYGAITIFVLRLLPLVSFDATSYAAGLRAASRSGGSSWPPRSGCFPVPWPSFTSAAPRRARVSRSPSSASLSLRPRPTCTRDAGSSSATG